MRTSSLLPLLPLAACLVAMSACGSGSGEDSGTTDPTPRGCLYGDQYFQDGDEWDSPDGCASFRCADGQLDALTDSRFTVEGDLELTSQEDMDAQACLGVVEGALTVSDAVADLTPLTSLGRVGGDLNIMGTSAQTLAGLEFLAEIGGSVTIADNESLERMSFQSNMSVFGDLAIQNNDALVSLAGAEFIGQCSTCTPPDSARSASAPRDGNGAGFDAEPAGDGGADQPFLGTFYGAILIADNDVLTDVWAMGSLYYAWSDVRFRDNIALTSLSGLSLGEVQGDLEVSGQLAMPSSQAADFTSRVEVWGETVVCGNLGGEACM